MCEERNSYYYRGSLRFSGKRERTRRECGKRVAGRLSLFQVMTKRPSVHYYTVPHTTLQAFNSKLYRYLCSQSSFHPKLAAETDE